MIGELYFGQKSFDEAIREFKLVIYGYGGKQAAADIKPWQAFASFEAGQCYFVQLKAAEPKLRKQLAAESLKHFEYLTKNYSDDRLAKDAGKRIETLRQVINQ